ncbi:hypothetical protein F1C58_02390 [Glaciihabitans sp. INWT7]|uniref:hypothetical protein n=1 Tax=Glaciihabitans sp. INWT7 TaxID=2596912 RepID=UPI001629DC4B|nr:hypothetical protein [Glaciihabitans sp. INWT7]QNE45869.1 hypothetical protein F1C58_02390 [Glaciihabitans sp. INWT7]
MDSSKGADLESAISLAGTTAAAVNEVLVLASIIEARPDAEKRDAARKFARSLSPALRRELIVELLVAGMITSTNEWPA